MSPALPVLPQVILAPMEGLMDVCLRALLTERGGIDYLVTEFVRISQDVPGLEAWRRTVPELQTGGRTAAGVLAHVQLLGSHPERMAQAAACAAALGAPAIDLNFGCPARTVNRNDGGASLLRTPARMAAVIAAVRAAVPAHVPVSAKLRLGWDNARDVHVNADAAVAAGASWLTLHGRTKAQNYAPPVDWHSIGEVARRLPVPVVANGDIFDLEALARCLDVTGCSRFMLGRGAVVRPALPAQARAYLRCGSIDEARRQVPDDVCWGETVGRYVQLCAARGLHPYNLVGRLKQWGLLVRRLTQVDWFTAIKKLDRPEDVLRVLRAEEGAEERAEEASA